MSTENIQMTSMPCISTAHVTEATRDLLDGITCNGAGNALDRPVATWRYGWFVYVGESDESDEGELPQDLKDVFTWCRGQGFEWVRFDSAADFVDGLPTYTW